MIGIEGLMESAQTSLADTALTKQIYRAVYLLLFYLSSYNQVFKG